MVTHATFDEFAKAVQKLHNAHANWLRLNGGDSGDQNAWAYFWHLGRRWKVDADTRFTPILFAYKHHKHTGQDPFQVKPTPKRDCLVVIDAVQEALIQHDENYRRHKYLYIFAPKVK